MASLQYYIWLQQWIRRWEREKEIREWLDDVSSLDGEERRKLLDFFTHVLENEESSLYPYSYMREGWTEKERKQEVLNVFRCLVENKETEAADDFIELATPEEKEKLEEWIRHEEREKLLDHVRRLDGEERRKVMDFFTHVVQNNEESSSIYLLIFDISEENKIQKLQDVFRRIVVDKETLAMDEFMCLVPQRDRRELLGYFMHLERGKKILDSLRRLELLLHLLQEILYQEIMQRMSKGSDVFVITLQELVGMHHGPGPPLDSVTRIQGSKYWMIECDVRADLLITCRWSNPTTIYCEICKKETGNICTVAPCYHVCCHSCTFKRLESNKTCPKCGQDVHMVMMGLFQLSRKRACPAEDEDEEVPCSKQLCSVSTQSTGYLVLVKSAEKIVASLSRDPKTIAVHLFSTGFITKRVLDQTNELDEIKTDKARRLHKAVLDMVEKDPHQYKELVSLFQESMGADEELVKELRTAL